MGFWRPVDPFKYTGGQNGQNSKTIRFRPIDYLGQSSMNVQKCPFWPYFTRFAENTLFYPKFSKFPSKVPYFRLITRAKSAKMTRFEDPQTHSTS